MSNEKKEKNGNNVIISQKNDDKSVDKKNQDVSYRNYVDRTPKELLAFDNFILSDT